MEKFFRGLQGYNVQAFTELVYSLNEKSELLV